MADTPIPFPLSSAPGERPQESGGRLWNAYAERMPAGSRSQIRHRRSAGLVSATEITDHVGFRALRQVSGILFGVLTNRLYAISYSAGVYSAIDLGELLGSLPVTISRNNKQPTPDIVCVTQNGAFQIFYNAAPISYPSGNVGAPNSVCELGGYFIFTYGDGVIRVSELNSTEIKSNSYSQADKRPDGLLRGIVLGDLFYGFGSSSCQVYRNIGTIPFPLDYVQTIPHGITGTHAVAGGVEGWPSQLLFAADDNIVYQISGLTATPISTPDVSRAIASCADKTLLEAGVYMSQGNAFWWLTSPGEWTWEYNVTTGQWNERLSWQQLTWRARATALGFGNWIAGDRTTGDIYTIDPAAHQEGDDPLVFRIRSAFMAGWFVVHRAEFDMTAAVGSAAGTDPIETKPNVNISISLNGGYSFGTPVLREIGREGEPQTMPAVNGLGMARPGMMIELAVSDPVHVAFMGARVPDGKLEPRGL